MDCFLFLLPTLSVYMEMKTDKILIIKSILGVKKMKLYGIGNALLYFREQKKLSQIQVCEGICSEMTMSRIETGEREYDSLMLETLLSCVGKSLENFEMVLNETDYYLYKLRERIQIAAEEKDIGSLKEYLEAYKKSMPAHMVLHQQFLVYYEAIIMKLEKGENEKIISLLHKAIGFTRPSYKEKKQKRMLYSTMESMIIYQLSLYEDYVEEMFYPLVQFVEEAYDEEVKEKFLIPFYTKLIQKYENEGRYDDMNNMAEKVLELFHFCRGLQLIDIHWAKVKAQAQLYENLGDWNARKKELAWICNELYYMYMIEGDDAKMIPGQCPRNSQQL